MNGPVSSCSGSIRRQEAKKISSWSHVFLASGPVRADHLGAVLLDGVDLGPALLDAPVPGHDQPAALGDLRDPSPVRGRWVGDRARGSFAAMNRRPGIPGESGVEPEPRDDLRQAEHVGVEVEANVCRSGARTHAA
jgi:hypothetical protein